MKTIVQAQAVTQSSAVKWSEIEMMLKSTDADWKDDGRGLKKQKMDVIFEKVK